MNLSRKITRRCILIQIPCTVYCLISGHFIEFHRCIALHFNFIAIAIHHSCSIHVRRIYIAADDGDDACRSKRITGRNTGTHIHAVCISCFRHNNWCAGDCDASAVIAFLCTATTAAADTCTTC